MTDTAAVTWKEPWMSVLSEWFERLRATSSTSSPDSPRAHPEAILTKHAGKLMRMKGVLSVGIGRTDDGRPAIVLGLESDAPDILASVPKTIDGVTVARSSSGHIIAL